MDAKFLERTREKLKHDLSYDEQEVLRKCSATVGSYSKIGSVLGGSLSVYGMYRRKLWPLSKYWGRGVFFGIGGIVVGMQIGLVAASIRCVQIVKTLPDPQHVMKALREVQVELQDARRRPLKGEREWTQRSEGDRSADDESASLRMTTDEQQRTSWATNEDISRVYNGPGPAPSMGNNTITSREASQNVWQQLRGEASKQPETAWDRIRKGQQKAPPPKDDSPFAIDSNESYTAPARLDNVQVINKDEDDERARQQREFDAMLEQERAGAGVGASTTGGFKRGS